jgi:GNAT superfamily N-acetyltransferase
MKAIMTVPSGRVTRALAEELNQLLSQVRHNKLIAVSVEEWREILKQPNVRLFVIREENCIVGMGILRWHNLAGGAVALLEDVVVRDIDRGRGLGKQLVSEVIEWARRRAIRRIDLTSTPSRTPANALYQALGWVRRDTNVYRLVL